MGKSAVVAQRVHDRRFLAHTSGLCSIAGAGARTCTAARARTWGRVDANAQFLLRMDALARQKIIALLVQPLQQIGQRVLQWLHHHGQIVFRQSDLAPLLYQQQAQIFRSQKVAGGKLTPLHCLHAQPQRLVDGGNLLGHCQGHACSRDAVFHHFVAEQLESIAWHQLSARSIGRHASLRACHRGTAHPFSLVLLKLLPSITPELHVALRTGLRAQNGQKLHQRLGDAGQTSAPSLLELLAYQLRKP